MSRLVEPLVAVSVIGDVQDMFVPGVDLIVTYATSQVNNGYELKPSAVALLPRVDIGGEDPVNFYTLIAEVERIHDRPGHKTGQEIHLEERGYQSSTAIGCLFNVNSSILLCIGNRLSKDWNMNESHKRLKRGFIICTVNFSLRAYSGRWDNEIHNDCIKPLNGSEILKFKGSTQFFTRVESAEPTGRYGIESSDQNHPPRSFSWCTVYVYWRSKHGTKQHTRTLLRSKLCSAPSIFLKHIISKAKDR